MAISLSLSLPNGTTPSYHVIEGFTLQIIGRATKRLTVEVSSYLSEAAYAASDQFITQSFVDLSVILPQVAAAPPPNVTKLQAVILIAEDALIQKSGCAFFGGTIVP